VTATCHDVGETPVSGDVVALVGCPNTGKSSIFNHLTGLRVRTANYPGVTVTRTAGRLVGTGAGSTPAVTVTDLPGTYGLEPLSPDEQIVVDHLHGRLPGTPAPDALVLVVDATTLRRSLSLVAQALALGRPALVALTMTDELRARGGDVDAAALARALDVPVLEVVGHRGHGVDVLRTAIGAWRAWGTPVVPPPADDEDQLDAWVASVVGSCCTP
jgi:ferrous iron transport protein B